MPQRGQEQSIAERLDRYTMPVTETGCWLWTGGCETRGFPFLMYGRIWVRGRTLPAHRVSYEHHVGVIPEGMCVMHKCDVPLCINPQHLKVGVPRENTGDMIAKGRNASMIATRRGESSNWNKLTRDQVLAIRVDSGSNQQIADAYGVTRGCIIRIRERHTWGWL